MIIEIDKFIKNFYIGEWRSSSKVYITKAGFGLLQLFTENTSEHLENLDSYQKRNRKSVGLSS